MHNIIKKQIPKLINYKSPLENYERGALWKTRVSLYAINANTGKDFLIPKDKLILVLKIKELLTETQIKCLYNGQFYFIPEIHDVVLSFHINIQCNL